MISKAHWAADFLISIYASLEKYDVCGILKYNNLAKNLFSSWETNTIKSLKRTSSTKLGILGAGMIGASVAIKAKALGFQVSFFDPFKESGFEKTLRVKRFFSCYQEISYRLIL